MFQSIASKLSALKAKFGKKNQADVFPDDENIEDYVPQNDTPDENFAELNTAASQPYSSETTSEVYGQKRIPWLKWLLAIIFSLLVVLFAAGYYYISNIDWNQHKDKISAEFSDFTGKRIIFEGPVHLTLLPSPNLQAENIKIYNPGEDLDEPLAKIKSLTASLTLKALLQGDFDVKMMTLQEPEIRLELLDNNQLNWDTPLSDAQRAKLENMQITLDSVVVQNAKIHFINERRNIDTYVNNINAEVIAQSIFGPYRIEGTYIKNDNPEGFAFSIGKITSGLSTSVNAVINQPSTETFVRFDGSVLPQNAAINGNLIFESKKLMNFVNSNLESFQLKAAYDYPLAVTFELKSNKSAIEVKNFVAKYGDTAGAGNMLIPLRDDNFQADKNAAFRPKIEFVFNFTNLDLTPVSVLLQDLWNKYKDGKTPYNPQLAFDLLADFKAVKTIYNNQTIKDFSLSLDVLNNKINIREFKAVLPGDASFALNGDIYSDLGYLTFQLHPLFKTDEFRQTLAWLNVQPQVENNTLLRRVDADAVISGNLAKVSISPLKLTLDKINVNGEVGIINDDNISLFLALNSNALNLDEYFPPEKKQQALSLAEALNAQFKKMSFLNELYAELRLGSERLVYDGISYAGIELDGSLQNGDLLLRKFSVADVAGAQVSSSGVLKGFGDKAEFENLKFELNAPKFVPFAEAVGLENDKLKNIQNFNAKGIVTGYTNRFATKTVVKADTLNLSFSGQVEEKNGEQYFNGNLDVKSPDFVKMLNDFGMTYAPKNYVLGSFNLKTKIAGTKQKFETSATEFNIGSNTFSGSVVYDASAPRKNIFADLTINRFELDKFFYNSPKLKASETDGFQTQKNEQPDFLKQPSFDNEKFNFDFLNSFDFSGNFDIARIIYHDLNFDYATFSCNSQEGAFSVKDFKADFGGGLLTGDWTLRMNSETPTLDGKLYLSGYNVADNEFGGMKYGLRQGQVSVDAAFSTDASSFADMYDKLKANGNFALSNVWVKGWNMENIYNDLINRQDSQGLTSFMLNNLQSGEALIQSAEGKYSINNGLFSISDSKWYGQEYSADVSANCSLRNWEGSWAFAVKFMKPDYLPGFKINYGGALDNPELSVDNEELSIMFNERQKSLKQQQQAAFEAQQAQLKKELDDQLLKTRALQSELENLVRPDLELKKSKVQDADILTAYQNIEGRIENVENNMAEILLVAQNPELSAQNINDVKMQNEQTSQYVADIKKDISNTHMQYMKSTITQKYNHIREQVQNAQEAMQSFEAKTQDYVSRLKKINSTYFLDDDENFVRLADAFKGSVVSLRKIAEKVVGEYNDVLEQNDELVLDRFYREVLTFEKDIEKLSLSVQDNLSQVLNYAEERVKILENAYAQKVKDEAIRQKLKENTGSISVKGTGVSKTVVRNIEDIEKSEEALGDGKVRVLDFSGKSDKAVSEDAEASTDAETSPNASGIVKKADGKISKATGVIIRK